MYTTQYVNSLIKEAQILAEENDQGQMQEQNKFDLNELNAQYDRNPVIER